MILAGIGLSQVSDVMRQTVRSQWIGELTRGDPVGGNVPWGHGAPDLSLGLKVLARSLLAGQLIWRGCKRI